MPQRRIGILGIANIVNVLRYAVAYAFENLMILVSTTVVFVIRGFAEAQRTGQQFALY